MNKKVYKGGIDRLRSPKRMELLEIPRVVELTLDGMQANSLLDIGTGTGIFAEAFQPQLENITGIDTNPDMLETAISFVPTAKFQSGKAESIPFDDDYADILFFGHVLHESDFPLTLLEEAKRVAAKRVAILEWSYKEEDMGPPIDERIKPDVLIELANKAGYQNVKVIKLETMVLYLLDV